MKLKLLSALVVSVCTAQAQAALVAGDLMFTSFNADEDGFSLVTFVDLAPNTAVFFSDNEWNGAAIGAGGAFNSGESYSRWNSGGSLINAGSVIRFSAVDSTNLASSIGSYSRVSVSGNTNYGIANSNETLYAYLGSAATAPSLFLSAITNGNFAADGSIANTGLVQGTSAIDLNGTATTTPDYGVYSGVRSGLASFAAYKVLVGDAANWTVDTTNGNYASTVPDVTAFSVSQVPLPAGVWLLGSALVGVAGLRRRV
ncbi:MAG TPA: VPLPA-CTERM sorting domain-containing protein [Cellvibrionaceae bacterium]|nr:VPLPA-CTERM sorting domain-containing protein [Cellvibrionaceae bacterium]HMY39619.1 VPLPA-CTERM sorting domain-containing protein [Marinagarivorans sp.]HNG60926.1 VPLPA-CTERM sorting domain-containing protein [Cellvibrionaceae bacterium]